MNPLDIVALSSFGVLVFVCGIIAICIHIHRVNNTMTKMVDKLASLQDDDSKLGGVVLLPVTRLDIKAEVTTVLPLPMGAELCQHTMDTIINQTISAPHEEKMVIILQCTKCGAMDKTVAMTSPPPPALPQPKSECRHRWIKEKTVNLDSAFEQMESVLKQQFLGEKSYPSYASKIAKKSVKDEKNPIFLDVSALPAWMFKKTSVRERLCSNCGEVDRVVVSNFDTEEEQLSETQENV